MLKKTVLRGKKNFSAIYKRGKSVGDRYVVLFYRKNGLDYNRIAFLASKKVGNSVVRHHVTRLVREGYRLQEKRFNSGLDIVVVARSNAASASFREVESALLHLGRLQRILKDPAKAGSD